MNIDKPNKYWPFPVVVGGIPKGQRSTSMDVWRATEAAKLEKIKNHANPYKGILTLTKDAKW